MATIRYPFLDRNTVKSQIIVVADACVCVRSNVFKRRTKQIFTPTRVWFATSYKCRNKVLRRQFVSHAEFQGPFSCFCEAFEMLFLFANCVWCTNTMYLMNVALGASSNEEDIECRLSIHKLRPIRNGRINWIISMMDRHTARTRALQLVFFFIFYSELLSKPRSYIVIAD